MVKIINTAASERYIASLQLQAYDYLIVYSGAEPKDNVFSQIFLNCFSWLFIQVDNAINCERHERITQPKYLYSIFCGLARHVLFELAPPSKW